MLNHFACLLIKTYYCHYMGKSRKRFSVWKDSVQVNNPTQWCTTMVVVPKRSGSIRICVDLTPLNESVMREIHPIQKIAITLAQLTGAKLFTKLNTNIGFWQVPLPKHSRLLTTFITPYGRFCFNTLPFGIISTLEHYQWYMYKILQDFPGMVCHIDMTSQYREKTKKNMIVVYMQC